MPIAERRNGDDAMTFEYSSLPIYVEVALHQHETQKKLFETLAVLELEIQHAKAEEVRGYAEEIRRVISGTLASDAILTR
jgi:hypothetical protein